MDKKSSLKTSPGALGSWDGYASMSLNILDTKQSIQRISDQLKDAKLTVTAPTVCLTHRNRENQSIFSMFNYFIKVQGIKTQDWCHSSYKESKYKNQPVSLETAVEKIKSSKKRRR